MILRPPAYLNRTESTVFRAATQGHSIPRCGEGIPGPLRCGPAARPYRATRAGQGVGERVTESGRSNVGVGESVSSFGASGEGEATNCVNGPPSCHEVFTPCQSGTPSKRPSQLSCSPALPSCPRSARGKRQAPRASSRTTKAIPRSAGACLLWGSDNDPGKTPGRILACPSTGCGDTAAILADNLYSPPALMRFHGGYVYFQGKGLQRVPIRGGPLETIAAHGQAISSSTGKAYIARGVAACGSLSGAKGRHVC